MTIGGEGTITLSELSIVMETSEDNPRGCAWKATLYVPSCGKQGVYESRFGDRVYWLCADHYDEYLTMLKQRRMADLP
jgi:hypothetical protein